MSKSEKHLSTIVRRLVKDEEFDILRKLVRDSRYHPVLKKEDFLSLHKRYSVESTRMAYLYFASSGIMKAAYDKAARGVAEEMIEKPGKTFVVADVGIGEALLWKFFVMKEGFRKSRAGELVIHGVDFSKVALIKAKEVEQMSDGGICVSFIPCCESLQNFRVEKLTPHPTWLIASLSLHHLDERQVFDILRNAFRSGVEKLSIVEVDADVADRSKTLVQRNLLIIDLYEDVFASVRKELATKRAETVLDHFYKPELYKLLLSDFSSMEERFMSQERWASIVLDAGYSSAKIETVYYGFRKKHRIFHLYSEKRPGLITRFAIST